VTKTPSAVAIEMLKERVMADASLDTAIQNAIVSDLENAQPSKLTALKRALADETTDAAVKTEGKQPEGPPG
jgi:phenylpyruvate tautomerase PptA (4-oxalocrotonate tautomerase family)